MSFVNLFWQCSILLINVSLILQWSSGAPIFVLVPRAKGDILNITKAEVNIRCECLNTWRTENTHTHTRLTALCPGLPGWAGTRKVKPIWILLMQELVSGSGISWAICKSAPRSRQIATPATHHSVFYRPDGGCPSCRPINSVKALKAQGE